jgi:PAS domain S-box-containing protein
MVWMSGPDGLCTFFNEPWLEFTGRSVARELGNGWAEGVHPEDRENCMNQYVAAFEARKSFELDYRLLRHDGCYRWVVGRGIPRYGPDASFLGYVGSCVDITDRKEAEDRSRQLNIQIIHAQEAERSRIAQELHDDVLQRIATISMRLHLMSRKGENPRLPDEIDEVRQSTVDLGRDISRIAHQLHPGTIEKLGLLPSLRVLCQQANIDERTVKLVCEGDLPSLDVDVAVALYRVTQESLRNAVSHGAATQVTIDARITTTMIQLSIKDNGCGFDAASVRLSGLGLSGMAERMKNVGGTLNVVSHPGKGTTVTASVPIVKAMKAAGRHRT